MTARAETVRRASPANLREWGIVARHAMLTIVRGAALILTVLVLAEVRGNTAIATQIGAVGLSLGLLFIGLGKGARSWAFYVVLFVLFAQLRAHADEIGTPVQFDYAITAEKALFLGWYPQTWLQDSFYTHPRAGLLEIYTMVVYLSYFFVPHIVALILWKVDRPNFRLFAVGFLATVYIGLLVCALVPTAPPWMASEAGKLPVVYQIVPDVLDAQAPGLYQAGENTAGSNAVAAMPSLHCAVPWLMVLALWKYRYLRWAGLWYACSMSFAVLYLGEHYFVDAIAGLMTAAIAWVIARTFVSWWEARRGGREVSVNASAAPLPDTP
jgi:hypothetical protein